MNSECGSELSPSGAMDFLSGSYSCTYVQPSIEANSIEGWTYVQLYDPDKKSMAPLGLNSLPHSLFIDANGVVVYHYVGAFGSVDQMRQLTAQYLKVTV